VRTIRPKGALYEALHWLIDYAGLFPPAQLPMEGAVAEYDDLCCGSDDNWMLGRFIVPVRRLAELREAVVGRLPMAISVIASVDDIELVARDWWNVWGQIETLEIPLGTHSLEELQTAIERCGLGQLVNEMPYDNLPTYVEGTRDFASLARYGLGAKLRCGGVEPSAFPSVEEISAFIAAAVDAGVPFKATAGLHHPVRHFNEEAGVMMHGFLNILIGAAMADKVDRAGLEAIIAEQDPAALPLRDETLMRCARERFVSYGSCSFDEPVADLRALGVLPSE
jgi:hypothetical protein